MALTASASRACVAPGARTARRGAARRVAARRVAAQAANSSYVRKHILDLAPYTPIVPFEILSGACLLRDRAASRAVLALAIARGARVDLPRVPDPSPLDASLRRATRPRPGRHREVGREREPLRAASRCVSFLSPTPIDGAFRVDPNVSAIAIDVATARGGRERAPHRESASPRPKRLPTLNQRPHTADARRLFPRREKLFFSSTDVPLFSFVFRGERGAG